MGVALFADALVLDERPHKKVFFQRRQVESSGGLFHGFDVGTVLFP